MASTPAQLREGLRARLAAMDATLQTYVTAPAVDVLPCAFVGSLAAQYHTAMGNVPEWTATIWVLVSDSAPTPEAWADVDLFVAATGTLSVRAALEDTDRTLGGVAEDVVVDSSDGSSFYVTENGSYFGASFSCRILAAA